MWSHFIAQLQKQKKKKKNNPIRDLKLSDFLQWKSSGILKSPIALAFAKCKCIFHWLSQEELGRQSDVQGVDGDSAFISWGIVDTESGPSDHGGLKGYLLPGALCKHMFS